MQQQMWQRHIQPQVCLPVTNCEIFVTGADVRGEKETQFDSQIQDELGCLNFSLNFKLSILKKSEAPSDDFC